MPPVRVEVTRGDRTESTHLVDAAIVDADGGAVASHGDVETPRYPRSAIKAMLAVPLAEAVAGGWALPDAERALALACASHAGQDEHVGVARAMLAAAGAGERDLACGAHRPFDRAAADALVRAGRAPCALHNNCSGKHAGLVCLSAAMGVDRAGYIGPGHPAMREATASLAWFTGTRCDDSNRATDGCSIPTYAIPLARLAHGFARFGAGRGVPPARAAACAALRRAVEANPVLLSGTGRFDTVLSARLGASVFLKGGAEGVWCASLPGLGLGIAIKAADGGGRAAQAAIEALVCGALGVGFEPAPINNWAGTRVGEVRVAA